MLSNVGIKEIFRAQDMFSTSLMHQYPITRATGLNMNIYMKVPLSHLNTYLYASDN